MTGHVIDDEQTLNSAAAAIATAEVEDDLSSTSSDDFDAVRRERRLARNFLLVSWDAFEHSKSRFVQCQNQS